MRSQPSPISSPPARPRALRLLAAALAGASLTAGAANYDVALSDLAPYGPTTQPFTTDDTGAPLVATGAPVGYGKSSFSASVSSAGATAPDRYKTVRILFSNLFGRSVTIDEIAGFEYRTNKAYATTPTASDANDWRPSIYTAPQGDGNDLASWYRNRLQAFPNTSVPTPTGDASRWNTWSTSATVNELRFSTNRTGFTAGNITWTEFTTGVVTRGSSTWDFSNEVVSWIDFTLGANTWSGTANSQIDAIVIRLTDGSSADVDLEDILYVNPVTGNDGTATGTQALPYLTPAAAITAAIDGQTTVKLLPGSYATSVAVNKGIRLAGSNLRVLPGETRQPEATLTAGVSYAANGASIGGLELVGPGIQGGQPGPFSNIDISSNYIRNVTTQYGITYGLSGGPGTTLGGSNWRVVGNTVENILFNAATGMVFFNLDNIVITDNVIDHTNVAYTGRRGINADGLVNAQIARNSIDLGEAAPTGTGNAPWILQLSMSNRAISNITVADNTLRGAYFGITTLSQNSVSGLVLTGNDLRKNYIGIALNSGGVAPTVPSPTQSNIEISDNLIQSGLNAVRVRNLHSTVANGPFSFTNIDVTGNTFQAAPGFGPVTGIQVETGTIITDNGGRVNGTGNWWGRNSAPVANVGGPGDMLVTSALVDFSGNDPLPTVGNSLYLEPTVPSLYIQPTETAVIDLKVANLLQPIVGLQAELAFSSTYFRSTAGAGEPVVAAGGGIWTELIYDTFTTGGDLDVAVGLTLGGVPSTIANATTAIVTLTPVGTEGITQVAFRTPTNPNTQTQFATPLGGVVLPVTVDSANIIIDGTVPVIGAPTATQLQDSVVVNVLNGANPTLQGPVTITSVISDALAGLASAPTLSLVNGTTTIDLTATEAPAGTFTYTFPVTAATLNGTWTGTLTATDRSGNVATSTFTLEVNKHQITGTIEVEGFTGTQREVVFNFTDNLGTVIAAPRTVLVTGFTGGVASFTLTNVPTGTQFLSGKTSTSLRSRVASTPDADGQRVSTLTGTDRLLGGDFNGTNGVNIQDFALLRGAWFTTGAAAAVADITGDNTVNTADYNILRANWFVSGDQP